MLKGLFQNLLINRICPNPLMFLQGALVLVLKQLKYFSNKMGIWAKICTGQRKNTSCSKAGISVLSFTHNKYNFSPLIYIVLILADNPGT